MSDRHEHRGGADLPPRGSRAAGTGPASTDAFLAALSHPRRDDIALVRAALLAAEPRLAESIKWNGPHFTLDGLDRVTFRVQPGDAFQIILHRGARASDEVRVADPEGLVRWAGPDRGVLTVPPSALDAWLGAALPVMSAWVHA